jgi:hypothetical protein
MRSNSGLDDFAGARADGLFFEGIYSPLSR